MAVLTTSQRNKIPPGKFGLFNKQTGKGSYPMPDAAHAGNAKARASQQEAAGNLSSGQEAQIDAKANKVLNRK